jgi:hypothetical protein
METSGGKNSQYIDKTGKVFDLPKETIHTVSEIVKKIKGKKE